MDDKIRIPDVIERFRAYHQQEQNLAWGSLHIVLDDGNVERPHVEYCLQCAVDSGDEEGAALAGILLKMSKTQRGKIGKMA